jgi:hypothetical protein
MRKGEMVLVVVVLTVVVKTVVVKTPCRGAIRNAGRVAP